MYSLSHTVLHKIRDRLSQLAISKVCYSCNLCISQRTSEQRKNMTWLSRVGHVTRSVSSTTLRHTKGSRALQTPIIGSLSSSPRALPAQTPWATSSIRKQSYQTQQQQPSQQQQQRQGGGGSNTGEGGADTDKAPEPPTASNIVLGLVLIAFVGAVYQYTMKQMQATVGVTSNSFSLYIYIYLYIHHVVAAGCSYASRGRNERARRQQRK